MKVERYIVLLAVVLAACQRVPEDPKAVRACADAPQGRACAMCFAADSTVYIAGGRVQDGRYPTTMLRYDAAKDRWDETAALPITPRVNGTVCATEQGVYMGLGFAGGSVHYDSVYLHDWWHYEPATDTWTRLADYPAPQTAAAVSWYDGQQIWVACGFHEYTQDVWRYEIAQDRWIRAEEQSPIRVMSAVAAQCDGRYFVGTGFHNTSHSYWYEWLEDGRWVKCASVPGKGRHNAACSATDNAVWLFGGWHYGDSLTTGFYYEDILRYSPANDQWTLCGTIPCGTTENGVACTVGERVYFGLGEDKNGHIHTEWYYIED